MRAVLFDPSHPLLLNEILPPELGTRERQYPALGADDRAMTNGAMGFRQRPRRRDLRERLRRTLVSQEVGDIDEDIARMKARAAKHREYVGQLLDLLSQKRLDKMRERGIQRTDVTPEIAHLGMLMARTICDHLVISKREELDAGFCDIESLWAYLMNVSDHVKVHKFEQMPVLHFSPISITTPVSPTFDQSNCGADRRQFPAQILQIAFRGRIAPDLLDHRREVV